MALIKHLLRSVAAAAPAVAITSLLGIFGGLGTWRIPLFLAFASLGILSIAAARLFDKDQSRQNKKEATLRFSIAAFLVSSFVGGVLFIYSDLPQTLSSSYAALGILAVVPVLLLIRRRREEVGVSNSSLKDFEREVEGWPPTQAEIALTYVRAALSNNPPLASPLSALTSTQRDFVAEIIRRTQALGSADELPRSRT